MKQKAGTIIFIIIVITCLIITYCIGNRQTSIPPISHTDSTLVRLFEDSLINMKKEYESRYTYNDSTRKRYKSQLPPVNRHTFDPNTADSIELLEQGFKPWQVRNMLKYRAKGGKWKKSEDMLKIYGVDSAFYAELEPYIHINDSLLKQTDTLRHDTTIHYALKKDTIIELNTADTTDLKQIRHIGDYVANRIIWYRNKLGGYYTVEQIAEIKDLPEGTFDKIKGNLTVNPELIKKIDINKANVSELSRHPYIRTEQAKQIYKYRREKIRIKDIGEIHDLEIFTEKEWQQLLPYLE